MYKEVRGSLQETTIQMPPEVKSACVISFRMFNPDRIQWKPMSSSRQSLDPFLRETAGLWLFVASLGCLLVCASWQWSPHQ
jgi:hypothetical protein